MVVVMNFWVLNQMHWNHLKSAILGINMIVRGLCAEDDTRSCPCEQRIMNWTQHRHTAQSTSTGDIYASLRLFFFLWRIDVGTLNLTDLRGKAYLHKKWNYITVLNKPVTAHNWYNRGEKIMHLFLLDSQDSNIYSMGREGKEQHQPLYFPAN